MKKVNIIIFFLVFIHAVVGMAQNQNNSPAAKMEPVKFPWIITHPSLTESEAFVELADFYKLNLNIKDTFRIVTPADMTYTGIGSIDMPIIKHPEMSFDDAQELSLLEEEIRINNIFDKFLETASHATGAALLAINPRHDDNKANEYRLNELTYCLRNPLNSMLVSQIIADRLKKHFNQKNQNISTLLSEGFSLLDVENDKKSILHKNDFNYTDMIELFDESFIRIENAFKATGDKGKKRLEQLSIELLSGAENNGNFCGCMSGSKISEEMLSLADKVNLDEIFAACRVLFKGITPYNLGCMAARLGDLEPIEDHPGVVGEVIVYEKTKYGLVVIGGTGANIYKTRAALIIDLGGNDVYAKSPAAADPENPISMIIDFNGNDTYIGNEAGPCSACCGISLLMDFDGNDIYSGNDRCEGWASFGIAILADFNGSDIYRGASACQGGALFGVGMLADNEELARESSGAGNDFYAAISIAQGVGFTKGLGLLIDTTGNDYYRACENMHDIDAASQSGKSYSQGFGCGIMPCGKFAGADGGIGALIDLNGDDYYLSESFSQGMGFWCSIGILHDNSGNDNYFAKRYCQGAAMQLSVGSLIDHKGNDNYYGFRGFSQGAAYKWSVGSIYDAEGDDRYMSGTLSQGAGLNAAFGMIVDAKGDDSYRAEEFSQGFGNIIGACKTGGFGLLLDGEGADKYYPHGDNKHVNIKSNFGIAIDK